MTSVDQIPERILDSLDSLPMLSPCASKVLAISEIADHTVGEIARVVEADSILTGHILKVVNSAAFALSRKIETVERAVSYLGKNVIVGIALSHSVGPLYQRPLRGYEAGKGDLWAHSL